MTNSPRPRRRRSWWGGGGRRGWPLFFYGLAFFAVGLVITVATYAAASSGGRYLISYGPMVVGLVAMVRGLIDVMRLRRAEGQQPDAAAYQWASAAGAAQPQGAGYAGSPGYAGWPGDMGSPGYAGWPGDMGSPGYAGSSDFGAARPQGVGYPSSSGSGPAGGSAPTPPPARASLPAANWYADPQDDSRLRWWDGQAWTSHTHPRS